jgi:hypothetical protein
MSTRTAPVKVAAVPEKQLSGLRRFNLVMGLSAPGAGGPDDRTQQRDHLSDLHQLPAV